MFNNNISEIQDQNSIVISHHLVTNIDIHNMDWSPLLLLIAAVGVIIFTMCNNVYVFYFIHTVKAKIEFKTIPNYFKVLSD